MGTIEKGSLWLFASRIVFFMTGYLLYFIMGRFLLTPEQFGTFGVVVGLVGITSIILAKGIQQSVSKFVSAQRELATTIKFKAFKLELFLSTALFLVYFFSAQVLAEIFHEPGMVVLIQISAICVFFTPLNSVVRGYLNGLKRFKEEAVFATLKRTLRFVLPVLLVIAGFSLFGVFLGIAIAAIFAFAIGLTLTGSPASGKGGTFSSNTLLIFAIPVIGFSLIQALLTQLDVFFIKALVEGGSIAGYYVAASTLGKLPYEIITVISLVLFPLVSETTFANRIAKTSFYIFESFRYALLFILPIALIASVTALPLIMLFYGGAYAAGAQALGILAIAYIFLTIFTISATIIIANGKPRTALLIGAAALLLDLILNYSLVPLFGMQGAAIATLVAMCFASLIAVATVFAEFRVFPFKSAVKILFATAVTIAASTLFSWQGPMLLLQYAVLLALYVFILFLLREIKESDITVLRNAFS